MKPKPILALLALASTLVPAWAAAKKKPKPPEPSALERYVAEAAAAARANNDASPGSLWSSAALFTDLARDLRASRVNDTVTVLVAENASAVSSGNVQTARTSSAKASITALGGVTKATGALANLLGTSGDQELKGSGTIGRQTVISTTLGTRVVHVLPNGYLETPDGDLHHAGHPGRARIAQRLSGGGRSQGDPREFRTASHHGARCGAAGGSGSEQCGSIGPDRATGGLGQWKGCGGGRHQASVHPVPAADGSASVLGLEETMRWMAFCLVAAALAAPAPCATRLKDLAGIEGVRDNQLIGYGLVVGLAGKGDTQQTLFSPQSLANMLERMGVSVPGATLRTKDMAAVMITATLPPFAQPGIHLDVTAAAIGDATNLQGGVLLLAPQHAGLHARQKRLPCVCKSMKPPLADRWVTGSPSRWT